ncbi:MAG TPA: sodium-independent anion transporter [Lachnoclostridium phytofermentans]|uniref:Sodium-independent anion transporter n=1 Tax=Lachnoclostridium phytofermentans TaxID=66219 RepID=A0A3D2X8U8_9FIRM|nr:SulP family inorganic anion transporter [Lachnoclostridium sp.]HCL03541.1 sodium-independent anion transporter [Lachnoclostridium phytofermentans]
MEKMKPKIFSIRKNYSKQQFIKDMRAGIIVAIIALPLSIAFAIGSGVSAEKGIYSAIISSIVVALLGGSSVQITGPTGAFIIITQSILTGYGMNGLMIATIMAGVMLLLMGVFKLGKLIRFIPAPITIGFTGGIAITIFTLEIKDFLGITVDKMPTNFFAKWSTYIKHFSSINLNAVLLGLICIAILVVWPKFNKMIPNSLIALIVGTTIAYVAKLDVKTLGMIPRTLTVPSLSGVSLDEFFELLSPAFTIAILVAMQALLSAVVTDGIINSKHRANMELVAEGVANTILGLLGCIPATGGVARSIANAKNGGRTPIAAIFHGLTLFFFLMVCMPLIQYVPLCVLASILIVVSYNMFNVKAFLSYRKAPRSDVAVLIASCVLTFAFNLVLAIEVGMVMSCILFMKRMADATEVKGWTYLRGMDSLDEDNDPDSLNLKEVPRHTLVFEVSGPMFFGAADKLIQLTSQVSEDTKVVVVRMRSVPAIDITAMNSLKKVHQHLAKNNVTMVFSHVLEQPLKAMRKAGFVDTVGDENICESIDAALDRAEKLSA